MIDRRTCFWDATGNAAKHSSRGVKIRQRVLSICGGQFQSLCVDDVDEPSALATATSLSGSPYGSAYAVVA